MLKAFAKTHGIDLEELLEAAAAGDPEGLHRFAPARQASIDRWRDGIRHTLVTLMHQAGVRSEVIADVVGHEKGNFTLDTYGSGSSMAQKLEALSKVAYGGSLMAP